MGILTFLKHAVDNKKKSLFFDHLSTSNNSETVDQNYFKLDEALNIDVGSCPKKLPKKRTVFCSPSRLEYYMRPTEI